MRRAAAALAVHRRLALVLGLWVAFQSVTGLVLLFRDPIEHRAHPGLTRHGSGDLGAAAALDAVHRRFPDHVVGSLATPAVSDGVYVVEIGDRPVPVHHADPAEHDHADHVDHAEPGLVHISEVYVDPAQATVNGISDHDAGFVALLERLHRRLLFDKLFGVSGKWVVAALGVGWVVLALTGLDRTARNPGVLHRRIGLVVVAPMVLVAVTGIRLAVPGAADWIWAEVTGSSLGGYDSAPAGVPVMSQSQDPAGQPLDATQILAALGRTYPDGQVARLLMPDPGDRMAPVIAGVSVGLDPGRGQHEYGGNTVVFLDQFSGDRLWVGRPDSLPAARQAALLWSRPLHTGAVARDAGRLVWGWMALAVVALAVSGRAARRMRTLQARLEALRWQRPLRRRKALARQDRLRGRRTARNHLRRTRRLRRRRAVQARILARGLAPPEPLVRPGFDEASPDDLEIDLTDSGVIDLTDPSEIDLTDAALVLYESEITLESGETLESGIVLPRLHH
jgi:uncharacterized iron-regulated membrane protein